MEHKIYYDISLFSDEDIYYFKEGTHRKLYEHFGSHLMQREGVDGVYFAVWAPNALNVAVVGDFNHYDTTKHYLKKREDASGIWEGFITDIPIGSSYKYYIYSDNDYIEHYKADPYAVYAERKPKSASVIWDLKAYTWSDKSWMCNRKKFNSHKKPISIYEVHLGSWKRKPEENNRYLTYIEAAKELAQYLKEMHYTHIELMPVMEHPFDGSWGYQITGYFAPTSRYGTPQEFMEFVDIMHQNGIGVILDWVPSHFVNDGHGLSNFDGTCLYEHKDPRQGYHPEWKSSIFNYDRNEVRAFLISSAMYWFDKYHIDGIRVDGVASMLYLNYARDEGEWIPNEDGSNINKGAVKFLQDMNVAVYGTFKDIFTVAEESTNFPQVTGMVKDGGLGFGYKWNMGWMHDILKYMKCDPYFRKEHHKNLIFSFVYMFFENYILPLSHDEVVHMKGSLINKMPGSYEQKFANLRALYAFMTAHPGKKLLFMGGEFAQFAEWNYEQSLDWHLLDYPAHKGVQKCVQTLNKLYKDMPSLHRNDVEAEGFYWIEENDANANVIAFIRKGARNQKAIIIVCNFSGKEHIGYPIGVPARGIYKEFFNSNSEEFGGECKEFREYKTIHKESHGKKQRIEVTLPPLSVIYLNKE